MKRILAPVLSLFTLMFPPSAIALATATTATQVQPAVTNVTPVQSAQVDKRELIAVAVSATQNKDYQLALRVADNTIELFPKYGTGYLYKAIALYKLGKFVESGFVFDTARILYYYQLKSENITPQEEKEARLGLETAELHLKILKTIGK